MKYMIAHMVRGEVGHFIKNFGEELADIFTLEPLSKTTAPRVTLKAPFETSPANIERLQAMLRDFAASHKKIPLIFDGFGQFKKRVIFADIVATPELKRMSADLERELRRIPWMSFSKSDAEKKLHASLVYVEEKKAFPEIANYLKGEGRKIQSVVDNVAILSQERERGPWKLHSEFELPDAA